MLTGEKVLITGASGQIALPMARKLARDNEVWGVARFRAPQPSVTRGPARIADLRSELESAGVTTLALDLAGGDLSSLPDDFSTVIHMAVSIEPTPDYDHALRMNAEVTGELMAHCRSARAFLHMSTCSVYRPAADPAYPHRETDPLGEAGTPFAPTYSVSKIGGEAVARFCARQFGLPTTIARMNVSYGANGGMPAYMVESMLAGRPVRLRPPGPNYYTPIHEDDIIDQVGKLLDVAAVPAEIVNWGGDDIVSAEEWIAYLAELTGLEARIDYRDDWITSGPTDNSKRIGLIGACRVGWREGMRRMVEERHPELQLRDGPADATRSARTAGN